MENKGWRNILVRHKFVIKKKIYLKYIKPIIICCLKYLNLLTSFYFKLFNWGSKLNIYKL